MKRQASRGNKKDYFESQKAEFYQNLLDGYREISQIFPERILTIDGSQSAEKITQDIHQDLQRMLT